MINMLKLPKRKQLIKNAKGEETELIIWIAIILAGIIIGAGTYSATVSIRDKESVVAQNEVMIIGNFLESMPLLASQGKIGVHYPLDPRFSYSIKGNRVEVKAKNYLRFYTYAGYAESARIKEEGKEIVITQ